MHISTDIWSQKNYRHSYAVINGHLYIQELGRQKTICLGMREVEDHSGDTILRVVEDVLGEFGKSMSDVGIISTDNASANKKAFK